MSLVAEGLSVAYSRGEPDEVRALDDVSVRVEEGEFVLILGCSGSGKSTLLRCLSGLSRPARGKVMLDGIEAGKARKLIGFAVQSPERALFEKTLYDDIAFGPKNQGLCGDDLRRYVMEAAGMMGLDDALLNEPPGSLSHGQKRLAAIAGVAAIRPKYMFLDEPTAGLDADGRRRVTEALAGLNKAGTTIILASHNLAHFMGLPCRVVVLDSGKKWYDGSPEGLLSIDGLESLGLALPPSLIHARELKKRGIDARWDEEPERMAELLRGAHESHL